MSVFKKETVAPSSPFKSGTFKPSQTRSGRDYQIAAQSAVLSQKGGLFSTLSNSASSSFADVVNPSTSAGSSNNSPATLNTVSKGISAGGVSLVGTVKRASTSIGVAGGLFLFQTEAASSVAKLSEVLDAPTLIPIVTVTAAAGAAGVIYSKIKSFFKRYKDKASDVVSLQEAVNNSLDKKFLPLSASEQKQFLEGYHARMRDDANEKTKISNFSDATQKGWEFASSLKNSNVGLFGQKVNEKAAQDYLNAVTFHEDEKSAAITDDSKSQLEESSLNKEEENSAGFVDADVKNVKANVISGKESMIGAKAVAAGAVTAASLKSSSISISNKGKIMQLTNADSSTVRNVSQAFKKFNEELDEVFSNLRSAVSDASDNWSDERYDEAVSAVDDISGKLATLTEPSEEAAEAAEKYASKIDEL